jgi:DHA1 family tetracycline resistance protein-like MFS transporter
MKNSRLLTIFLVIFIDLLGFSLILPLLSYYAGTFGANALMAGWLIAFAVIISYLGPILPHRRQSLPVELR